MPRQLTNLRLELDNETNRRLERWSEAEGRKKRPHANIIVRRLLAFLDENPAELERLGLVSPLAMRTLAPLAR